MKTRVSADYGIDAARADLPQLPPATRRAPEMISRDAAGADGRTFTFVASTADVDRMGDTIAVSRWQLDAFRKNPVVLLRTIAPRCRLHARSLSACKATS
jgi:hypothetical protein